MRLAVGVAALALILTGEAGAHSLPGGRLEGYVATVAGVQPNVLGLRATTVLGDQLAVSNLSTGPVVILDQDGRPSIRIPSGGSRTWHDARVVEKDPPKAGAGEPHFVKNWSIPGRAGNRRFAITGFLGWVPPQQSSGNGTPLGVWLGGAAMLIALSFGALWLLGRSQK